MTNKDLDLPTQQELLAQYRCDEIANSAFITFQEKIKEFRQPIESGSIVEDLGPKMKDIRGVAMSKLFSPSLLCAQSSTPVCSALG